MGHVERLIAGGDRALGDIHLGFDFTPTADVPIVLGDFLDQDFLGGGDGLMLGAQISSEFFVTGRIFTGDDDFVGIDSVFEGVFRGSGFTFRGSRAGRLLGIFAIDFSAGFLGRLSGHNNDSARSVAAGRTGEREILPVRH